MLEEGIFLAVINEEANEVVPDKIKWTINPLTIYRESQW